jgi:hypothetical protein
MSRLLTRLRKLEAQLTDRSGLVPHTQPWWDYWLPVFDSVMSGERSEPGCIPLEVWDAIIAAERAENCHEDDHQAPSQA